MEAGQLGFFEELEPPPNTYPAGFLEHVPNAPQLQRVHIDGLKGFDHTTVELPPLTVLTGPNNSGKSTVLQAIALGYECLRRCVDPARWRLVESGRAVTEFEFLPVNEPRDLWYRRIWKPSREKERSVEIGLEFDAGLSLTFRIRFLFGVLNIKLADHKGDFHEDVLKGLLANSPVLLPATPGPAPHEEYLTEASVHRALSVREPGRVVRNILQRIQNDEDRTAVEFVQSVLAEYFGATLETIAFDDHRDLEIRAPIQQEGYSVDIVSSGSGLNQVLQLASVIAWRRPSVVLLDEPDAHLHTSVQTQLFDFLSSLVSRHGIQVILSTHSRDLISQAPLESIVPVDPSRAQLRPLESLDHLLLEYQRYGPLSNVDLALLYQTKSCVFVEGPTDVRLLPRIADRCGIGVFAGPRQAIPFEFQGVDKLKFLPDLVRLFERLVGGKLRWAVIRDSDANVPEVKSLRQAEGDKIGATYFHQWSRHSLENYLLEPALLVLAVSAKKPDSEVTEEELVRLLEKAVAEIEDSVSGTFVTRTQLAYRDMNLHEQPHDEGAKVAARFLRGMDSLEKKLAAYPGKLVFGAFVQQAQGALGINLRVDDVVAVLDESNTPAELAGVLAALRAAFP